MRLSGDPSLATLEDYQLPLITFYALNTTSCYARVDTRLRPRR
jgi:hypothetical protein